jgi:hypothetical protein
MEAPFGQSGRRAGCRPFTLQDRYRLPARFFARVAGARTSRL